MACQMFRSDPNPLEWRLRVNVDSAGCPKNGMVSSHRRNKDIARAHANRIAIIL